MSPAHALVPLLLFSAACGPRYRGPVETRASFERIQVAEAQVVLGTRAATDAEADEATRRAGRAQVCAAAEALCVEADRLEDPDARRRCERATERCEALEEPPK